MSKHLDTRSASMSMLQTWCMWLKTWEIHLTTHKRYNGQVLCGLCCNDLNTRPGTVHAIHTRSTDKLGERNLWTHPEEQSVPIQWTTAEITCTANIPCLHRLRHSFFVFHQWTTLPQSSETYQKLLHCFCHRRCNASKCAHAQLKCIGYCTSRGDCDNI